jgi:hypothetical protein|tara:strand:+ start:51 stop:320 length:270 start_codon:yes stop_codon:yes gene_type:complete
MVIKKITINFVLFLLLFAIFDLIFSNFIYKETFRYACYKYDIEKVKFIRTEIDSLFGFKHGKKRAFGRYIMRRGRAAIDVFKKQYERLI